MPPQRAVRREIVLGTGNRDKLRELRRLLSDVRIRVVPLSSFPTVPRVVENGKTFDQNASKKARAYSLLSDKVTIADDSGLCVRALNGRPGVYSARFAGPGCTYEDNNRKLLKLLSGKTAGRRSAYFHCTIAVYRRGRKLAIFRGQCHGRIAEAVLGKNGFGYDPVFLPGRKEKTFAELSPLEKNRVSHRGKALRAAKKFLKTYFSK